MDKGMYMNGVLRGLGMSPCEGRREKRSGAGA